jgi:RNA polymerase sigma-70 factor (ECF subfamily)
MIKLLEGFSRPAVAPGLVGILENKTQMKRRISMIGKFKRTNQWSVVAVTALAGLALVTLTDPPAGKGADEASPPNPSAPPRILSSRPRTGDTEVDPGLQQVTVTFDRDMDTGGYSWTGGGPEFPGREDQRPRWRDQRTCVLPVKVEAARYYRVGINAPSFRNFRSAAGVAVVPTAILFTTKGATLDLKRKATHPQIVALTPKNGARDVDSSLTELRVTFNVPMGDGFSWTGGGPEYPNSPPGKKPYWTEEHLTCVLPVQLQPGSDYRLGLNSPSFRGFQSATGVPLEPVSYRFKTK